MGEVIEIKKGSSSEPADYTSVVPEPLDELSRRLVSLSSTMGNYYLTVGARVQEYSDRSARISGSALAASRIISGDDLKTAIVGLSGMVDQMEEIFNHVETVSNANMEKLGSIGGTVRSVEKELDGLSTTSRDLKMLALSTKIQSTKTGVGSSAFMQLGEDIGKMSVIISSKAEDLLNETTTLSDFIRKVQANLYDLRKSQREKTESVLTWIRTIIESLSGLSNSSRKEAERIRKNSDKISQSVADMVTSVQYQDISKQQLEKVIEGLEQIKSAPPPETGERMVSAQIHKTGQCLEEVHRLRKTDVIVQESLGKIVHSLQVITESINKMTEVTSVVNRDSIRFMGELDTAISSITSFLEEVLKANREMSVSMNSLGQTIEGMSEFAQDIEMISSEVELISLNARIMAAQAGTGGAGMGIIAEAVKETAAHSDDQRISVVGMLNEVSRASLDLKKEMETTARDDEVKLDQLVREFGVFLEALQSMQKKIVSMMSEIDEQSDEMANAVNFSIDNILDHDRLENESAEIARAIKDLALYCSGLIETEDLLSIAGAGLDENDLKKMDRPGRLAIVEKFFMEHCPDSCLADAQATAPENEDIVFFDSEG